VFTSFPWLSLLGAGIALAVGVIAFLVASGLVNGQANVPSDPDQRRSTRRPTGIRRAS